ncbi:FAD-dependent monooxygenase [Mycolicibacterium novocastrense]|uniref:FAD-dependent monooxygenase n=1 Tax=Mycolicibacterium novocastrense TaxID=59813 RepID=A0AAW5SF62_MYCNV|nr:NAD(P)/FAD-dependent oxidoreductase [Mycolicibacterium novocastrense]MCV7021864.1 FAD-dependent monooxygenase [Mycolicibacterium novocastrense]GAT11701.1 monooxygenase FAD-binding [Mycolicibacterium novocastrense]
MLSPTSLEKQYERAAADEMRILVVGAGIAGVTAAQLLRGDGRHPVLIERAEGAPAQGYMLALMPMVDAALDDLAVRDAYRAASVPLKRYAVRGHTGRLLRTDSTVDLMSRYGDYRGIARGPLIDVLAGAGCPVTYDAVVTDLAETSSGVDVGVRSHGADHRMHFDLVVIADGMHSKTRGFVLDGRPVEWVDTGWGGWVVWAPDEGDPDLGEELWGARGMVAMYPVADALGVFLGGPREDTAAGPAPFVTSMRRDLKTVDPRLDRAMAAVATDPDPYYWSLTDCRAPRWTTGRTVLLGDAAAGFLPTAGVGAGMAMESAWVLSRMLRHAPRIALGELLRAYEHAQRPRVEAAQDNSRQLAKVMFRRSRTLAVARELAMRVMSVERALRPIQRLLQQQPDPEALVDGVRGTSMRSNAL